MSQIAPPPLHVVSGAAPGAVMFDSGNFSPYYIDSLKATVRCRTRLRQALEMGRRAWPGTGRDHDWSDVARQTLELYRSAAGPARGGGPR